MSLYDRVNEDRLPGGKGDKLKASDVDPAQLRMGIEVEMEHTKDKRLAREIALDHLAEDPKYYTKLKRVHREAVGESDDSARTAVLAVLGEKSYGTGGRRIVDVDYVARKAKISASAAKRILDRLVAEKLVQQVKQLRRVPAKWGKKEFTRHAEVNKYQLR